MAINITLILMAAVCPALGFSYVKKENRKNTTQICLFIGGLTSFLWCFGYGIMGLCTDTDSCYFWRALALFGVVTFLVNEYIFVVAITRMDKPVFKKLTVPIAVMGLVQFILVIQPEVVNFYQYKGRTVYSGNPGLARIIQGFYSAFLFFIMFYMAIHRYVTFKYKRDHNIIIILFISHFSMIIGTILDVLIPLLGHASFPGSAYGCFICYILNLIAVDQLNYFDLSASGMSSFIYHNVDSSVLFFDNEDKLIVANEFALRFLNLNKEDRPFFSEVFKLTPKEAKKLLLDNFHNGGRTELRLNTRNSDVVCSVILNGIIDKNGEPMYTACFVYDLTKEVNMYNEVEALKEQLQIDLEHKTEELRQLSLQSIRAIANTIDAKDEYTKGHSERVAAYSALIAEELGLSEIEIQNIRNQALLHDIGKIGVRDSVLNKPSKLTPEEYEELKQHTTIGASILSEISLIPHLSYGAAYHHEWYNGKGYPYGLAGEDIPYSARIICVADSFDAMNSRRIYRRALGNETIQQEMERGSGTQFDPQILSAFLKLYQEGKMVLPDNPEYSNNLVG